MISAILAFTLLEKPLVEAILDRSWKETLVVGHRGAAAYKPENTLESFEEAIGSGAVATECDVHMSRDGVPMIMHDETLDRTSTLVGAVKDLDASVMSKAGVPTLADFLKVTKDRIVSIIEIKAGDGVVKSVVEKVRAEKMIEQSIIFSFNADYIRETEDIEPRLRTVWLKSKPENLADHFAQLGGMKADGLGVQFRAVTPELVAEAHKRKVPVFVWTVPPGTEVDRLRSLKVNFIITDHPRDVREQLAR